MRGGHVAWGLIFLFGCAFSEEKVSEVAATAAAAEAQTDFCYEMDRPCGPLNWAALPIFGMANPWRGYENRCGESFQSPVAFGWSEGLTKIGVQGPLLGTFLPSYPLQEVVLYNDGHTVHGDYGKEPQGSLLINNGTVEGNFPLRPWGFHVHVPAEHHFEGETHPMELHIVHVLPRCDNTNTIVVIGLFVDSAEPASDPTALDELFTNLPEPGSSTEAVNFDLEGLLPHLYELLSYHGSLTVPPCLPVQWYVVKTPIYASHDTIARIGKLFNYDVDDPKNPANVGNARPIQNPYRASEYALMWNVN